MRWPNFTKRRDLQPTFRDRDRAARVKDAARRGIEWAWHLSLEHEAFAAGFNDGVWNRHCREERFRARVKRFFVERLSVSDLHDPPQIHDRNPIRDVAH